MLKMTAKVALRNVIRNKGFAAINITGLAIGITCALIATVFIRYELSFDRHGRYSARTYKVVQDTNLGGEEFHWNTTAYPLAEALRNDFSDFEYVTQVSGPVSRVFKVESRSGDVSRYEEPRVLFVDTFYPQVFDLTWLAGNPEHALKNTNSCVLTESLAKKFFSDELLAESIVGRQIYLNNRDALIITGIVQDPPATISLNFSMLVPYEFFRINNPYFASNWSGNYQGTTFIVLRENASSGEVEKRLASWKKKYLKAEDDVRISYKLQPLRQSHTDEKYGSAPQSYSMPRRILIGAVIISGFVLLMACINFVNLATATAATRAREVGIRKVMGSSRPLLVRQFFMENLYLVAIAVCVSLALSQLCIDALNDTLSIINLNMKLDILSVLVVLAFSVILILAACLYPAVVISAFRPVEAFRKTLTSSGGKLSLRRTLILFQFVVVQVLVLATIVVGCQIYFMNSKHLGFSREKPVLITTLHDVQKRDALEVELRKIGGIEDVTFSSSSPMSDYNHHYGTTFRLHGQAEELGKAAEEKGVDLNFIEFYQLELVAGRNFSALHENFDQFIVNEKLVKELGLEPQQALGEKLVINEGEGIIVGVVKDFHNNGLQEELTPCLVLNSYQWLDRANIKLSKTANLAQSEEAVQRAWQKVFPEGVYSSSFLDDSLQQNYELERLTLKGIIVLAVLAVFIGCLGLYGLLSFITLRKTKEVGIRKVLGATATQIVLLFGKEFIVLVLISFVISMPFAYLWLNEWLSTFAYRIGIEAWMYGLGMLLTLIMTMATVSWQSVQAALSNPVDALRTE